MATGKELPEAAMVAFEFPDDENAAPKQVEVDEAEAAGSDSDTEAEKPEQRVDEDTPAQADADPDSPSAEELASYSEKVQKRIKALTKARREAQREAERVAAERDAVTARYNETAQRAQELERRVATGTDAVVSQAQKLADAGLEKAKADLRKAYEAGDTDQFLTAQDAYTRATLEVERLKTYKPQAQKNLQSSEEGGNVHPQQTATPTTRGPSQKARDWFSTNQWFGKDEDRTDFARALHIQMVQQGVDPESDAYYDTLNSRIRRAFPAKYGEEPATQAGMKPANVVAPSGRATTSKRIHLSATQVAFAKRAGIPLEEYARQIKLMEKDNG